MNYIFLWSAIVVHLHVCIKHILDEDNYFIKFLIDMI